ncbi:MAG: SpoIIE family protein phosphatase [Myxococcales bacterium]|jgi:phosphoserine phosphatase RsbU/P|nr:SpoIIE family protein phosphatase [Myxococcales bacterium]
MSRLDEVLEQGEAARVHELAREDLERLFWKYKGLRKQVERDTGFWRATNDSLKLAYERLDEQERELARAYQTIRNDLEIAQQVQHALLPKQYPDMTAQLELAVFHKQMTEVGGDYYDFFRTREGNYAIGLFDISGHGVSAALIMAFLKAQFMQTMEQAARPKEIVEWVNNASLAFLREVRRYATVNFVVFADQAIRYVCGGGYGVLVRGGEIHTFSKGDPFIGLRRRPFTEFELPFYAGDLLALYTDGLVETQNAAGEDYTSRRLNNLIREHAHEPVARILERCVADYRGFCRDDTDDITLILLRRRASEPQPAASPVAPAEGGA